MLATLITSFAAGVLHFVTLVLQCLITEVFVLNEL